MGLVKVSAYFGIRHNFPRRTKTLSVHPTSKTRTLSVMSWDCGLRYVFMPPVLQLGGSCALRSGGGNGGGGGGNGTVCGREELTSRLGFEAVQRLAKDGCRLLQNHNYRLPDRSQAVSRACVTWPAIEIMSGRMPAMTRFRSLLVKLTHAIVVISKQRRFQMVT